MIKLIAGEFTVDAAKGDAPRRTISGTAVPYNVPATVSDGTAVIFRPGSLPVEGKAPRLFMYHDASMPVGVVTERVDTEQGMMFSAKISATALGNDALVMAMDGTIDQVSVGVNPIKFSYDEAGTMIIEEASWQELSLVPIGAFGDMANIASVAASIHQEPEEVVLNEEVVPEQEIEPMSEVTVPAVEATISTAPIFAQAKREFAMPSAAEVLAAYHIGGDTYLKVSDAFKQAQRKNQTALQAAAGDIVTGDTPGLLNIPVLGPLFQDLNFVRPVVSAFGARAMPSTTSRQFVRPTITTHTSAAVQSNQLDAVSATTMVIAANTVTKSTVAGQVTLSIQDIDFTDPSALQLVLNDLAGEVLIKTDDIAADALVAGKTASGSTWTVTDNDPSSLIQSLYDAAREITEDSNYFPTHLCVSPDVWQKLGQQLDGSKRPVLGYTTNGVMGQNSIGRVGGLAYNAMDVFGLDLVVDNNFAAGTMLVVYSPGFEIYESGASLQSFENPSTLGRTLSIHQYFATFVAKSSFIQSITIA
jgi:HK97 family phage prohead protease